MQHNLDGFSKATMDGVQEKKPEVNRKVTRAVNEAAWDVAGEIRHAQDKLRETSRAAVREVLRRPADYLRPERENSGLVEEPAPKPSC